MFRVMQMGLGPIGCRTAQLISERDDMELVGAVDIAPDKMGKNLGEVCGFSCSRGIVVNGDLEPLRDWYPDVAVVTTSSHLDALLAQIKPIILARVSIVSTCEELAYPTADNAALWKEMDSLARSKSVGVLGTGINPGFAMDALPFLASAPLPDVKRIEVHRRVNLTQRRRQLQQKMGVGMKPEDANFAFAAGKMGHVGLATSLTLLAAALDWQVDEIRLGHELLVAKRSYKSLLGSVQPGFVIGGTQTAVGVIAGEERIRLSLTMALEEENAGGEVVYEGVLPFRVTLSDLQGDWATAAITINAIRSLLTAPPGLHTMLDITPVVSRGSR